MSVFCRHNRFTADCPICSKGTVLDRGRKPARRSTGGGAPRPPAREAARRAFSGRYVSAGPYGDETGTSYEVRLERVPGGIRLAEWDETGLRRRAPVLAAADVARLLEAAGGVLDGRDAARLAGALQAGAGDVGADRRAEESPGGAEPDVTPGVGPGPSGAGGAETGAARGVSRGRSGDFKEELRVEPVGDGRVRVARWVLRPGRGWQLQEAPPMLPAARYAEAFAAAVSRGLLTPVSDPGGAARL